ncbi:MAG: NAD(P)/FAD-dependent oxidoreductase, partial [Candidatus Methylomirabilales bacterium]
MTPEGVVLGETVVLCAGPWSGELGALLGRPIPVGPAKGQLIASELPSLPLHHVVYTKEGYLVPRLRGELIAGSTVEFVGFDKRVTFAGLKKLVELTLDLLPGLKEQPFARAWAGLRPYAPDALPIIGPIPGLEGVFVATGHFRNGILLGPITGRLIRELILGEALSLPLEAFSPTRFDGKGQENR